MHFYLVSHMGGWCDTLIYVIWWCFWFPHYMQYKITLETFSLINATHKSDSKI